MNAIDLSIQGTLKPTALRHHVLKLGNLLGICGFLNYRIGMAELYIHAEGEEEIVTEFILQVKQLSKQHKLVCYTKPSEFNGCQDFKISPLSSDTSNHSINSNDIPYTDLNQNINAEVSHQKL